MPTYFTYYACINSLVAVIPSRKNSHTRIFFFQLVLVISRMLNIYARVFFRFGGFCYYFLNLPYDSRG